jgi:dCMP deaminase
MRPGWNQYFMKMAWLASERSTCQRRKVGAVIVAPGRQIIATGYNGAPSGVEHCDFTGCLRKKLDVPSGEKHELCRGVHAEQNAICQAARHGIRTDGADLYCTHMPCFICAKMIIQAGIDNVIYDKMYNGGESVLGFLDDAGVWVGCTNVYGGIK